MVKNLAAMWETMVQSLGWEDPLEKGMTTHSSILAWRIPRTEEPGRLQSMGSQSQTRLSYDTHIHTHTCKGVTHNNMKIFHMLWLFWHLAPSKNGPNLSSPLFNSFLKSSYLFYLPELKWEVKVRWSNYKWKPSVRGEAGPPRSCRCPALSRFRHGLCPTCLHPNLPSGQQQASLARECSFPTLQETMYSVP